jgi:hypothetical protein
LLLEFETGAVAAEAELLDDEAEVYKKHYKQQQVFPPLIKA